jgi:hypothetical protein
MQNTNYFVIKKCKNIKNFNMRKAEDSIGWGGAMSTSKIWGIIIV